jgi:hypothetical protein
LIDSMMIDTHEDKIDFSHLPHWSHFRKFYQHYQRRNFNKTNTPKQAHSWLNFEGRQGEVSK